MITNVVNDLRSLGEVLGAVVDDSKGIPAAIERAIELRSWVQLPPEIGRVTMDDFTPIKEAVRKAYDVLSVVQMEVDQLENNLGALIAPA